MVKSMRNYATAVRVLCVFGLMGVGFGTIYAGVNGVLDVVWFDLVLLGVSLVFVAWSMEVVRGVAETLESTETILRSTETMQGDLDDMRTSLAQERRTAMTTEVGPDKSSDDSAGA